MGFAEKISTYAAVVFGLAATVTVTSVVKGWFTRRRHGKSPVDILYARNSLAAATDD